MHGGRWIAEGGIGVALRLMAGTSTDLSDTVASRCRHPKLIKYYTDAHNVDEDLTAISRDGGWWNHETQAGAAHRDLYHPSTFNTYYVASLKNKD